MSIIDDLKNNEKPFGLTSEGMQAKAKKIEIDQFSELGLGGNWLSLPTLGGKEWYEGTTYRLRPDYEEKPEIDDEVVKLSDAVNRPDFIGFKYTDSRIEGVNRRSFSPRMYLKISDGTLFFAMQEGGIDQYEVLTPTHVLFRGSK